MSSLHEPMFRKQETFTALNNRTRLRSDDETNQLSNATKRRRIAINDNIHAASFQYEDYTVSWICALHIEMAAARAMLDSIHDDLPGASGDTNAYTLGNIGSHNIVIACLPACYYGTNNAATVANNIARSFPSIHIRLMVGIGGGAPGKLDLRLGDIVVGSRVMQYDLGKIVGEGQIERTGVSWIPPNGLLTYITKLRAIHESTATRVPSILEEMHNRHPAMTKYAHPSSQDRLFRADYDHEPAAISCDECNTSMLVHRLPRTSRYPKIHYEAIASSNQVMKHGITRDKIAQELQVACFEMEAAGLMNFPYLVIRGICDYSDSHKNKHWQEYAAAVAAAYAKEFLDAIKIPSSKTAVVQDAGCRADEESLQNWRKQFLISLKFDQIDSHQSNIKAAHTTTCQWFLKNPQYLDWIDSKKLSEHHGFLWLSGKPGAGKSTIMKFAHTRMKKTLHASKAAVSFFFNARGEYLERSATGMYRSLLLQLLERFPDLQKLCDDLYLTSSNDCSLSLDSSQTLFRKAISMLGQRSVTCFIDALDECDELQVRDMVEYFEELGQQSVGEKSELRICFSSRHYPYIFIRHGLKLTLEDQKGHEDDVEKYVQASLRADPGPLAEEVQAQILQKAAGVFMWVVLVVDILNKEISRGRMFAVKKRLAEIPDQLSDLFKDILRRDNENVGDLLLCLQWILYAKRPLKREEFYFAVSAGLLGQDEDPTECLTTSITNQISDRFITSSSKGLAEVTKSKNQTVQFIHESVRDFLIKDNGLQELWPELSCNFESLSHEKLKHCCYIYLQLGVSTCVSINKPFSKRKKPDLEKLRGTVSEKFPFLEYATQHVLYHANIAASSIPQDNFLDEFRLVDWIIFNNLFEKFIVRHYTSKASLFYVFADKGLSALIQTKLRNDLFDQIHIRGERYRYPLFAALINKHNDSVQALLKQDSCSRSKEGITDCLCLEHIAELPIYKDPASFLWAILEGHAPVVEMLVERGADINIKDKDGKPALYITTEKGHNTITRLLIEKGADTNAKDSDGETALWTASRYGREDAVRLIIEKGADINIKNKYGKTVLQEALKFGQKIVASLLIKKGADINAKDKNGQTALMKAVRHGRRHIASLLIEKGADINAKDKKGQRALMKAVRHGRRDIASLLIKKGADINAKDNDSKTALREAVILNQRNVASLLIEKGADINATDKNGQTALTDAVRHGHRDITSLLIDEGADISAQDNDGQTALLLIIKREDKWGWTDIARLLIEKGADVNVHDNDGQTALLLILKREYYIWGWTDIARLLIEKGADTNAQNDNGQTALLLIFKSGHLVEEWMDIARLLIRKGADINIKDNNGRTVLQEAYRYSHEDIVELLVEKCADSTSFGKIIK